MNKISIIDLYKTSNKLVVSICVSEGLKQYFVNEYFIATYSVNIEHVPNSIAIVPLIVQLLPVIWLTDSELCIDELDSDFCNSIDDFKKGYENMYPMLKFQGILTIGQIVDNKSFSVQKCASMFSGGADAFATLIAHIAESPTLVTVQGADIAIDNDDEWNKVIEQNRQVANDFNLPLHTISSNFTTFLNQKKLNSLVKLSKDNWWHGFQHGIGLLGLSAPLAYIEKWNILYIASSHTKFDKVSCASDPTIDNYVRYSGCQVVHDQYEYNRLQKIQRICKFVEKSGRKLYLRVCYRNNWGGNCCICEKCIRTAVAIVLCGGVLADYGFPKQDIFRNSKLKVLRQLSPTAVPLWNDMQQYLQDHPTINLPKNLEWMRTCDFERERKTIKIRVLNYFARKLKRYIGIEI